MSTPGWLVAHIAHAYAPRHRRWLLCALAHSLPNVVWFGGLLTYFVGNILFFAALSLAPASLCAALLATVVVANAVIARLLLKERLQRCDYHGGALICLGIAVAAIFAPYKTIAYDAHRISALVSDPHGALYLALLVVLALTLAMLVFHHERIGKRDASQEVPERAQRKTGRALPCPAGLTLPAQPCRPDACFPS